MAREYLQSYPHEVKLSESARTNLKIVKENYAFTGVMEITTGIVDLCAAAGTNPHYETITPSAAELPQMVGPIMMAPIVHGNHNGTSHDQLATTVVESRAVKGEDPTHRLCGFTVRFNRKPVAEFSGTSRSLNSGEGFKNGELEACLVKAIMDMLRPIVHFYGWEKFEFAGPRTDPSASAVGRLAQQGVAAITQPNRQAMLQGIQALGKKGSGV